jgi:peptidyl-prolyl isomerase H (cyclophilin H)
MKKILILILVALVLYLIYIYWQKYNLEQEHEHHLHHLDLFNHKDKKHVSEKFNQDKSKSMPKGVICENGICKLPPKNQNNNNYQHNKIQEQNNINSEENYELTEGALDLVDEYLQSENRPHVFMDITVNDDNIGRINIELYDDVVPNTVKNFIYMIENNYKGSEFHRIIKDFVIQGGDYLNGDGTGSSSIFGKRFPDENFDIKHDSKYLLSMANAGPDSNGCQFFITLNPLPNLDNKHVVFGKVVGDDAQSIVDKLGDVLTKNNDMPIVKCVIADCGRVE